VFVFAVVDVAIDCVINDVSVFRVAVAGVLLLLLLSLSLLQLPMMMLLLLLLLLSTFAVAVDVDLICSYCCRRCCCCCCYCCYFGSDMVGQEGWGWEVLGPAVSCKPHLRENQRRRGRSHQQPSRDCQCASCSGAWGRLILKDSSQVTIDRDTARRHCGKIYARPHW